jgi:uncharacterized protein (TIGR00725 family)
MARIDFRIAVIGESDADSTSLDLAEQVGKELAARNALVICGAMGGVMEAAARGAAQAGGIVAGIVPTASAGDANPFITVPIVTAMGEGRNIIVVRSAQAVIAIGGSYGTLSEIALALRVGLPVVGLRTWVFSRETSSQDPIVRANGAREAVEKAVALIEAKRT